MGKPDKPSERKRLSLALQKDGKCECCSPHRGGDNSADRKKRTDKHKNKRGRR